VCLGFVTQGIRTEAGRQRIHAALWPDVTEALAWGNPVGQHDRATLAGVGH
jgi:hypothetical protein